MELLDLLVLMHLAPLLSVVVLTPAIGIATISKQANFVQEMQSV